MNLTQSKPSRLGACVFGRSVHTMSGDKAVAAIGVFLNKAVRTTKQHISQTGLANAWKRVILLSTLFGWASSGISIYQERWEFCFSLNLSVQDLQKKIKLSGREYLNLSTQYKRIRDQNVRTQPPNVRGLCDNCILKFLIFVAKVLNEGRTKELFSMIIVI